MRFGARTPVPSRWPGLNTHMQHNMGTKLRRRLENDNGLRAQAAAGGRELPTTALLHGPGPFRVVSRATKSEPYWEGLIEVGVRPCRGRFLLLLICTPRFAEVWDESTGVGCEYHTLLDTVAHLFEQAVSSKQDIAQAVFGFGPDDELVSGDYVFPLFVRNTVGENPTGFTYLGNYSASRLDPVPWEELSNTVRFHPLRTNQGQPMFG